MQVMWSPSSFTRSTSLSTAYTIVEPEPTPTTWPAEGRPAEGAGRVAWVGQGAGMKVSNRSCDRRRIHVGIDILLG